MKKQRKDVENKKYGDYASVNKPLYAILKVYAFKEGV